MSLKKKKQRPFILVALHTAAGLDLAVQALHIKIAALSTVRIGHDLVFDLQLNPPGPFPLPTAGLWWNLKIRSSVITSQCCCMAGILLAIIKQIAGPALSSIGRLLQKCMLCSGQAWYQRNVAPHAMSGLQHWDIQPASLLLAEMLALNPQGMWYGWGQEYCCLLNSNSR